MDFQSIYTALGMAVLLISAVVTSYSVARNKGYEAQREALESWKANAEAKAEELKIERARVDNLRSELESARIRIADLEGKVAKLEALPDLSYIMAALVESKKLDDDRTGRAVAAIIQVIEASMKLAHEYHSAELSTLERIATLVEMEVK